MAYRKNESDKDIIDLERATDKGAIRMKTIASGSAVVRANDGTHGQAVIADTNNVVNRSRPMISNINDHAAYRGEACLVGRKATGNRY